MKNVQRCARCHSHNPKIKIKEIQPKEHKGNTFCPWVTLKDPTGEAHLKMFQTLNVPDIIPRILKEKYQEIRLEKHEETYFSPG